MGINRETKKPHAVCLPYPAQGHITPMLQLAKLLHYKGFHITFVNNEYNHMRFLKSRGPHSLDGLPDFRFAAIADGLPPTDTCDATQDAKALCYSIRDQLLLAPFKKLLQKLNAEDSDVPPVTCVVSDILSITLSATEELGIPNVLLWTASACSLMGSLHYPQLMERGYIPLKDESDLTNGYLDTIIDWIPGMKNIRLKDLPSPLRTTDPNDILFDFVKKECQNASRASAIIFNTFSAFEQQVLESLSSMFTHVYAIGPLQLLLSQITSNHLSSLRSNLWKQDPNCLLWLDSKRPNSVVYVNFGSVTLISPQQLLEFACGLASSMHNFLWIIRPDVFAGDSMMLPTGFVEGTKDRGLMASWCDQEEVLKHPSIGGFLTHCGWNSMIESVSCGVPMLCWPLFMDQQTNCKFACNDWNIGMEIDSNVKRDNVEKLVTQLMTGEKGKEMKRKVMEWKEKAKEAASFGGSSFFNINNVINEVLLPKP